MYVLQEHNILKEYIDSVTNQIRWNRAKQSVELEIRNHLLDQKEAFLAEGMSEASAEEEVVRQMGDPVSVGMELDSIHRPKTSKTMLVLTAMLIITGLLIRIFFNYDSNSSYKILQSIVSVSMGAGILIGAFYLDFSFIGKHPLLIYFIPIFLAMISFIFLDRTVHGIRVPSHYLILFFPLGYGAFIYAMRGKGYKGMLLCAVAYMLQCAIAIYAGSNSGLITIAVSSSLLIFLASCKGYLKIKSWIAGLFIPLLSIGVALPLLSRDYIWRRLIGGIYPETDPMGFGYINLMIRKYLNTAKLLGAGDALVDNRLPAADTDFLLSYLTHEYGWLISIAVVLLLVAFIAFALRLSLRQKSLLGLMVSTSVIITLAAQTIFYVLSNLGIFISAFSLPFISYGNIYTIIDMALVGIMLSVFRSGSLIRDSKINYKSRKFIRYENGTIMISVK